MKIVKTSNGGHLYIGDLGDFVSIQSLENKTAFLNSSQVEALIQELEARLKEMNETNDKTIQKPS